MFLFDTERTGRIPFFYSSKYAEPVEVWEVQLPQLPVKGPESSCVIDKEGNIYFGCHDKCIYSLDSKGNIRWQFVTKNKVYSSPLLLDDKIFFCINKAEVICLSTDGKLIWSYNALPKKNSITDLLKYFYSFLIYDYEPVYKRLSKLSNVNTWCSPNILLNKYIVVNLLKAGVVVIDKDTGKPNWTLDLGTPINNLASVAITKQKDCEFIAAVSQSNALYWINESGKVIWKKSLIFGANSWGSPCIDAENKAIYCSTSLNHGHSWIFKFDYEGNLMWEIKLNEGLRGGITLSHLDYILIPGFNGTLYFLNKDTGNIQKSPKIAKRMWTSVAVDLENNIFVNVINGRNGALIKLNSEGSINWSYSYGKALSVPVIDAYGGLFTASWDGRFIKLAV